MASREIEKIADKLRQKFEESTMHYPIPRVGGFAVATGVGLVSNYEPPETDPVGYPVPRVDGFSVITGKGLARSTEI